MTISLLNISISSPATASMDLKNHNLSNVKINLGLKDEYLSKICKNGLSSSLFIRSYLRYSKSLWTGSLVNENKNRFNQDIIAYQKDNKSLVKWLKKNKSRFKKSTQKDVQTLINNTPNENKILSVMSNSTSLDYLNYEYENWERAATLSGDAIGKIRKSLKLPPRGENDGCP